MGLTARCLGSQTERSEPHRRAQSSEPLLTASKASGYCAVRKIA